MSGRSTPAALGLGFAQAAFAIGALLVVLYWSSKALKALGGPDLAVPEALHDSADGLLIIGLLLLLLLRPKPAVEDKD